MRNSQWLKSCTLALVMFFAFAKTGQAQTYEEKFQDIFITAGYATAFGAALGAASLGLSRNTEKLDNIAIGASLGFIGGAVMGMYIVFSPVMVEDQHSHQDLLAHNMNREKLYIRPYVNQDTGKVSGLAGAWTVTSF